MTDTLLIEEWGLPTDDISKSLVIESINESKSDGKLRITGIFLQANKVNRNKRLYPKAVLEKAVADYIREQVDTKQALGKLNHPTRSTVDPREACILIEKMWWDGDNVKGIAVVTTGDYGVGDKLASLIRAGWVPGVSSRGLGRVVDSGKGYTIVQEGYRLTVGVDAVWGPSAQEAYVSAIKESDESTKKDTLNIIKEHKDDAKYTALYESLEKIIKD